MDTNNQNQNQTSSATFIVLAVLCFFLLCGSCFCGYKAYQARYNIDCSNVEMFSMRGCGWCTKAKQVLNRYNIMFKDNEYVPGITKPVAMPDGQLPASYPQIWVNGKNRGGYSELENWAPMCSPTYVVKSEK